ncbi:hypothetical protein GCM10011379_39870 [Filimonas zeae]|uniref:Uncharacterized protein n=1 Tax=Filimonas zeae TaxID=1737353 RepID=A0A917J3N0_9BACT|nr:hypothetical protein GCM10011379_39870 [Filimonas zeae]
MGQDTCWGYVKYFRRHVPEVHIPNITISLYESKTTCHAGSAMLNPNAMPPI